MGHRKTVFKPFNLGAVFQTPRQIAEEEKRKWEAGREQREAERRAAEAERRAAEEKYDREMYYLYGDLGDDEIISEMMHMAKVEGEYDALYGANGILQNDATRKAIRNG